MKNAKRIVALVMAIAMVMALGITSLAEQVIGSNLAINHGNGKIVVTGGEEFNNKTVVAVRFWDIASLENDNEDSVIDANEKPDYDIVNDWVYSGAGAGRSFFYYDNYGQTFGGGVADNPTFPVVRSYERLMSLDPDNNPEDAKLLAEFANEARLYYQKYQDGFDKEGDGQVVYEAVSVANGDGTYTATIDNAPTGLPYGYYLVFAKDSASGAMLVNVPSYEAEHLQLKSVYPTVDKKADGLDNGSANIGDEVTFTLESTVPNTDGYTVYKYIFKDTISKGLEFVPGSVEVSIKNGSAEDFSTVIGTDTVGNLPFEINDYAGSKNLEVAFANLIDVNVAGSDLNEGAVIRVTYKAIITEEALVDGSSVNSASIVYSNDPTDETGNTVGESNPDVSTVYNYSFEIHKFHTTDKLENRLGGAEFSLLNADETARIPLKRGSNNYTFIVCDKEDPDLIPAGTNLETNTDGLIIIKGLEAGTYKLKEEKAPEGYNALKAPIEITIDTTNGFELENVIYKVNGEANEDGNVIAVKNSNGTLLPSTGGIGTIIITVVGVAVVVGGFVLLRKKDKEDETAKA